MRHQWLPVVTLLLLSLFVGSGAAAQSVGTEQAKLTGYQQKLVQLQSQQKTKQADRARKEAELAPLLTQTSPEKDALTKTLSDRDAAAAKFAADPTAGNKSKLKNLEFKVALAERKYKKANSQQAALQSDIKQLSNDVDSTSKEIVTLTAAISAQQIAVEKARSAQAAWQQSQQVQREKDKAAAAEAELAKLRAEIEQTKLAEQAAKEAAAKDAAAAAAAAAYTVPSAAVATDSPKIVGSADNADVQRIAERNTNDAPATDPTKLLLTTKEEVAVEQARLEKAIAAAGGSKTKTNKILHIKSVIQGNKIRKSDSNSLRALGSDQYRGNATVRAGDTIFVVGFNRWREKVPGTADTKYTFILDASDKKSPRLVYFRTGLGNSK